VFTNFETTVKEKSDSLADPDPIGGVYTPPAALVVSVKAPGPASRTERSTITEWTACSVKPCALAQLKGALITMSGAAAVVRENAFRVTRIPPWYAV
jgi:hypothetical protein